ncbi:uncharacterized protein BDZ99DRAFT_526165 [Mytilinidion resinicola]|uniref:DUF7730 domain-containing protein n=1 Tax=Mytilinidion resinicola TaxID=574789 RepID=A0A6A6Y4G4_9PEZI|nr:uncharacterized protein BDZ99DRAFT_526165 [Mytilinidion resinicola]KAF2803682.1 hypothetical protein BDZ99DRAFT_526165 [Mytilinidion resinicola]
MGFSRRHPSPHEEDVTGALDTVKKRPDPGHRSSAGITTLDECPPFLRLPVEIRHEIFRYIVPSSPQSFRLYADCDATAASAKWNRKPSPHPDKMALAILRTNRMIYHEALSVLYSEHQFHFIGFNYLPVLDFIRRLSPDAKSLVRQVRLTMLADRQGQQPANHDVFCTVIHDFLPGLITLRADPWVFL